MVQLSSVEGPVIRTWSVLTGHRVHRTRLTTHFRFIFFLWLSVLILPQDRVGCAAAGLKRDKISPGVSTKSGYLSSA